MSFLTVNRRPLVITTTAAANGVPVALDTILVDTYQTLSVQITGTFSATITVQGTNVTTPATSDWSTMTFETPAGFSTTVIRNAGVYNYAMINRYFRVNVSAYVSGTINFNVVAFVDTRSVPGSAHFISDSLGISKMQITPFGSGLTTDKTYLTGGQFGGVNGTAFDPKVWVQTLAGSATGTTDDGSSGGGAYRLTVTTGATDSAAIESRAKGTFLGNTENYGFLVVRTADTGNVNQVKRWGLYNSLNGIFMEQSSTGLTIVTRKAGVDTPAPFLLGVTAITNNTNFHYWELVYSPNFSFIRQDGQLVHLLALTTTPPFDIFDLPVRAEIINTGASTASSLFVQSMSISRLGAPAPTVNENISVSIDELSDEISSRTILGADRAVFGEVVITERNPQIVAQWDVPIANNDVTAMVVGTGTATQSAGLLRLQTGTDVTASARARSNVTVRYNPAREISVYITASFTTPTNVNSFQRVGLYNDNDGLWFGYSGTTFVTATRLGGVDTTNSVFVGDQLDGSSTSRFRRNGVPEAIIRTVQNIYRIRWGFLGSAPIYYEVMSPDGEWVVWHTDRRPNTTNTLSIINPNLPITMEVVKSSSDATNLEMRSGSWNAGSADSAAALEKDELKSRNYKTFNLSAVTTSTLAYTVTTGRILKIKSIIITAVNTSVSATGVINIRDGGVGGTIRVPLLVGVAGGSASGFFVVSPTFEIPLRFTTNLFVQIAAGTLTVSFTAVGYESEV